MLPKDRSSAVGATDRRRWAPLGSALPLAAVVVTLCLCTGCNSTPSSAKTVHVPNVIGKSYHQADQVLTSHGVKVDGVAVLSTMPSGTVVSTTPGADASLDAGTTVVVRYSDGRGKRVPDLVGRTLAAARSASKSAGLVLRVEYASSKSIDSGKVISEKPAAGAVVVSGSTVTVVISTRSSSTTTTSPTSTSTSSVPPSTEVTSTSTAMSTSTTTTTVAKTTTTTVAKTTTTTSTSTTTTTTQPKSTSTTTTTIYGY